MKKVVYNVRVNGRVFESTDDKERRDWLLEHLPEFYIGATVTAEERTEKRTAKKY